MGEEVFSSLLFGWRVGMFLWRGGMRKMGKMGVSIFWLWIARDAECWGLQSMDYGGELLVVGGGLNCRNFAWRCFSVADCRLWIAILLACG